MRVTPAAPMPVVDDIAGLRRVLAQAKTIAVVGLSAHWYRPSYFAAKYMQDHGYRIVPVNPGCTEILCERCYPSIASVPGPVDIVDVFRRSDQCAEPAREAVATGARCLWLQLGIASREAGLIATAAGLAVVMNRCLAVEAMRPFAG